MSFEDFALDANECDVFVLQALPLHIISLIRSVGYRMQVKQQTSITRWEIQAEFAILSAD